GIVKKSCSFDGPAEEPDSHCSNLSKTMLAYFNGRFLISLSLILAYLGGAMAQSGVSQDAPIQKGHTHDILFVGWAPNGDLITSYSWGDGTIKLWEPHSGRLLWDLKVGDL